MKKIVGYMIKESCHSINRAFKVQFEGCLRFYKTKEQALKDIQCFRKHGLIGKNARPKVFRVIVEEV